MRDLLHIRYWAGWVIHPGRKTEHEPRSPGRTAHLRRFLFDSDADDLVKATITLFTVGCGNPHHGHFHGHATCGHPEVTN